MQVRLRVATILAGGVVAWALGLELFACTGDSFVSTSGGDGAALSDGAPGDHDGPEDVDAIAPGDAMADAVFLDGGNPDTGPTGGDAGLLGRSAAASGTAGFGATIPAAFRYRATGGGGVRVVAVYVALGTNATSVELGLYSDASGEPSSLLASGTVSGTIAADQWAYATLSSDVGVNAGSYYWIAVLSHSGQINVSVALDAGASRVPTTASVSSLPAQWPTPNTASGDEARLYAY